MICDLIETCYKKLNGGLVVFTGTYDSGYIMYAKNIISRLGKKVILNYIERGERFLKLKGFKGNNPKEIFNNAAAERIFEIMGYNNVINIVTWGSTMNDSEININNVNIPDCIKETAHLIFYVKNNKRTFDFTDERCVLIKTL